MSKMRITFSVFVLTTALLFSCRGGVNKNNDHDYDGKNENNDGTTIQQEPVDSLRGDTNSRYPLDENAMKDSIRNPKK